MPGNQNQRPRFFEGQYLGAEDLSAAVDYSRIQMARHVLGAHTWGIATGLQVNEKTLGGGQIEVHILPGYAWDGFGRPIALLAPYKIPTELFKSYVFDPATDNGTPEGRLIEVWLRYDEASTQNVRPGFEVCDKEDQRSRVQETFRIEIGARPSHIDRHDRVSIAGALIDAQEVIQKFDPQSPAVAIFDESVPYQDLPESGAKARWLIPLGYVRWKPNPDPNLPGNFVKRSKEDLKASRTLRRYIGVVAESVQAADGILRMRDRTKNYSSVQSDDLVWVEGNLRVEGDIRPFGGKLDFRHADGQDFGVPLKVQRMGDPGFGARALQVIVGPDSQTNNRFAVGPLKADGTADEKFVVLSGGNVGIGTVTPTKKLDVNGNINVNGTGDFNGAITANGAGDFNGPGSFNGDVSINGTLSANVKNFKIPHPLTPGSRYLIHSTLEGPEIAVFYRGSGQLSDGEATLILPDYFEALTRKENRTVLLTPRFEEKEPISALAASEVKDGQFKVRAIDDKNFSQKFYWEVKAIRADVGMLDVTG